MNREKKYLFRMDSYNLVYFANLCEKFRESKLNFDQLPKDHGEFFHRNCQCLVEFQLRVVLFSMKNRNKLF